MERIIDRLDKYMSFKGLNDNQITNFLGFSVGTIGKSRKDGRDLSLKNAHAVLDYFQDINKIWLLTGDGDMLNGAHNIQPFSINTEEEYKKAMEIGLRILPEVSFELAGGSAELINITEYTKRFWYLPDSSDCEGVATISGNSMAPAYPSGCQVALKKTSFDLAFPLNIAFGQVFGVIVEDEVTGLYHGHIKILRKYPERDKEKEYWIARSIDRENYDDFYIKISTVRGLWIVKQHIVQDIIL